MDFNLSDRAVKMNKNRHGKSGEREPAEGKGLLRNLQSCALPKQKIKKFIREAAFACFLF